ncbi:MAG: KR domain-containing protein [Streptomyces sp.]|nr:KR domain-containing protein [Streptomyces sp.]
MASSEPRRIEYVPCDFTELGQVRTLPAREGDALTGVVRNAGVDTAARLPKTTDDDILRTVATKIDSFVHPFGELADSRLKFFCNVGSLTGRLGGMVGQLEYAAANEALARLGRWADRRAAYPVMTLAWPTWDRTGLIANFSATRRYMAPLGVADGLAKWQAELLAGSAGEVTFVGPLGDAVDPGQATGHPVVPDLPGYAEVYPKIRHLGEATSYEPHARLVSRVRFDRDTTPALTDFLVDGAEAVPVSLLLENALRGAEWLVPPDFPELCLDCLEDAGGHPPCPAPPRSGLTRMTTWRSGPELLSWRCAVVPRARWTRTAEGRWTGEVRPCAPNDLWATAAVPRTALAMSALENVVRLCARQGAGDLGRGRPADGRTHHRPRRGEREFGHPRRYHTRHLENRERCLRHPRHDDNRIRGPGHGRLTNRSITDTSQNSTEWEWNQMSNTLKNKAVLERYYEDQSRNGPEWRSWCGTPQEMGADPARLLP